MQSVPDRSLLRNLPGEVRATLALSVLLTAIGFLLAAADWWGGAATLRDRYAGLPTLPRSHVERLLEPLDGPFNGAGTMRPAFTTRSREWAAETRDRPQEKLRELHEEREGERLAVLAWLRAGANRAAFDRDDFELPPDLLGQPITPGYREGSGRIRIRSVIRDRCADCHSPEGRDDRARLKPLDTYDRLKPYVEVPRSGQISRGELVRDTQRWLLGPPVLLAGLGVLCCFTLVPRWARFALALFPLLGLGIVTGSAWLSQWDARFTWGMLAGGAAIVLGVTVQTLVVLLELTWPRVYRGTSSRGLEPNEPASPGTS